MRNKHIYITTNIQIPISKLDTMTQVYE